MTYPSCPLDGPITLIIDENKADDHLNFLDDKCEYDTDVLREIGQNTKDEFGQRINRIRECSLKRKRISFSATNAILCTNNKKIRSI